MSNLAVAAAEVQTGYDHLARLRELEDLEGKLLKFEQRDGPLTHRFAPGVYAREIFMPADSFVLGHEHKTEHLNIVLAGRVRIDCGDGTVMDVTAGTPEAIFTSKPGVRKLLYIVEDCRWMTIHPTTETDLDKIEEMLIIKSETFLTHQDKLALEQLKLTTLPA